LLSDAINIEKLPPRNNIIHTQLLKLDSFGAHSIILAYNSYVISGALVIAPCFPEFSGDQDLHHTDKDSGPDSFASLTHTNTPTHPGRLDYDNMGSPPPQEPNPGDSAKKKAAKKSKKKSEAKPENKDTNTVQANSSEMSPDKDKKKQLSTSSSAKDEPEAQTTPGPFRYRWQKKLKGTTNSTTRPKNRDNERAYLDFPIANQSKDLKGGGMNLGGMNCGMSAGMNGGMEGGMDGNETPTKRQVCSVIFIQSPYIH
jgi:hypothetical protein